MQRHLGKIVCAPRLAALAAVLAAGCGGGLASSSSVVGGGSDSAPPMGVVVTLDDNSFTLSDDQRAGIVVPFSVTSTGGNTVLLAFQWTQEGEGFPDLPTDLAAALADPVQRRELRIATPYATPIGGRVVPLGAASVELPELGASQSALIGDPAGGTAVSVLDGLDLELLRPSIVPGVVAATWASNPLDTPVAALPGSDDTSALVLDRSSSDISRLRRIDLATGVVVTEMATGTGEPDTLALELSGGAVLYAEHTGTAWRVARVDLTTLAQSLLFDVAGPSTDVVRGLVSLGTGVALATVDDALLRLDYTAFPTTSVTTVLDGLVTPWGIVKDPVDPHRVFVAERDAGGGRVIAVSLDSQSVEPVAVMAGGLALPQALALERGGSRLLALTDSNSGDGTRELVALQYLGTPTPATSVLLAGLPDSVSSVATGADGLRLLALGTANDLSVGGGVEQRRTVSGYNPSSRRVTVSADFAPTPIAGQPWRLSLSSRVTTEPGVTRNGIFIWDSGDLPGNAGSALLRVSASTLNTEMTEHQSAKVLLGGLSAPTTTLGGVGITNGTQAVVISDLDADGDLDIVSANPTGNRVTVFFQTGLGVFDPTPLPLGSSAVSDYPSAVATGDIDGDGNLDIVSANTAGDNLTVFTQISAGTFDPVPEVLGGTGVTDGPASVDTADLNDDGKIDAVCANVTGNDLTIFFQPFSSGLPPLALGAAGTTDSPRDVVAADLDGDGDLDLVSANSAADTLTAFAHSGGGTFGATPTVLASSALIDTPFAVVTADLDGDGDLDLASANTLSNNITIFTQTSAGVFNPTPTALGDSSTTPGPRGLAAADVDGDGQIDLVVANTTADNLCLFAQISPGVFDQSPVSIGGTSLTNGAWGVAVADLDADGDADLVSANFNSSTLSLLLQSGPGQLDSTPLTLGSTGTTDSVFATVAADLDGDSDIDIATANKFSLSIFQQTGSGAFNPVPMVIGGPAKTNRPRALSAADLDGDGDLELTSANGFGNNLAIFFQNSPGVFDVTPLTLGDSSTTDFPTDVQAADIDGDGDLDLISSNASSDTLTLFLQTTSGAFDPVPTTLGGTVSTDGPANLAIADFDADGDLDLASANTISNNITIFTQTSAGVFNPTPTALGDSSTTLGPRGLAAADLDQDGDVDIASANSGGNTLAAFFQTTPGVFDPVPLVIGDASTTNGTRSITSADLDGDGDLELVSANLTDDTLSVFRQIAPGQFDPVPAVLGGTGVTDDPLSVIATDIDRDGDLDLISSNNASDNVSVFYNAHKL